MKKIVFLLMILAGCSNGPVEENITEVEYEEHFDTDEVVDEENIEEPMDEESIADQLYIPIEEDTYNNKDFESEIENNNTYVPSFGDRNDNDIDSDRRDSNNRRTERDTDSDRQWDYNRGGTDRDLDNDEVWDYDFGGMDRDQDNDNMWD